MSLFTFKGNLSTSSKIGLALCGFTFFIFVWAALTYGRDPIVKSYFLPRPLGVLIMYRELLTEHFLIKHLCRSLGLNIAGYLEAIIIAIPIGFATGLIPFFRGAFQKQIDAFRFLPLTALSGLFIVWFGIGTDMKVHFLACGILVYMLPIVVQRIDEVDEVYFKTVYTLGASSWQIFKTVYFPAVMSRLSDDIRVLTAISWTYIIYIEVLGAQGGIGEIIYTLGRKPKNSEVLFALLVLIIVIGLVQDRLFVYLDREFFPHKYTKETHQLQNERMSSIRLMLNFFWNTSLWVSLGGYMILFINEIFGFLQGGQILTELFGATTWVIHCLFFVIVVYKVRKLLLLTKQKSIAKAIV